MNGEIQIVYWNPGRLAFTGTLGNPHPLLDRISEVCPIQPEFSRDGGRKFTFSFPELFRNQVARVVERFPE
ncbi:MAG: hypothetical protein IAF94_27025 [Pirellulaceae bacterium]|nr:hypothetical protein [Pirellulaceae bacterium]